MNRVSATRLVCCLRVRCGFGLREIEAARDDDTCADSGPETGYLTKYDEAKRRDADKFGVAKRRYGGGGGAFERFHHKEMSEATEKSHRDKTYPVVNVFWLWKLEMPGQYGSHDDRTNRYRVDRAGRGAVGL